MHLLDNLLLCMLTKNDEGERRTTVVDPVHDQFRHWRSGTWIDATVYV